MAPPNFSQSLREGSRGRVRYGALAARVLTKRLRGCGLAGMRSGKGHGPLGTALRCALAVLVLMGSLAKGVVIEIEHEHHDDHGAHHEHGVPHEHHDHEGEEKPSDPGGEDSRSVPQTHSHLVLFEMGPMTAHSPAAVGHVPAGKPAASVVVSEECGDGPTFELLKPPQ